MSDLSRRTRRLGQIVQVFTRYGLADSIKDSAPASIQKWFVDADGKLLSDYSQAERLRLAFSELGTTFIKLGQMMSTRDDRLEPDVIAELKKLQADAPPDPPDSVRATLEEELGQPVEEVFATFEFEALGSASVGQVHAAEQAGDHVRRQRLVVRLLQRRGIEIPQVDDSLARDLEIDQRFLKHLLDVVPVAG